VLSERFMGDFAMTCVASIHSAPSAGRVHLDTLSIFVAIAESWQQLRKGFLDTYRPELHYMRGPGPKWREKHGAHKRLDRARSSQRDDEPARSSSRLGHATVSVIAGCVQ
jgi:hypothetical protein